MHYKTKMTQQNADWKEKNDLLKSFKKILEKNLGEGFTQSIFIRDHNRIRSWGQIKSFIEDIANKNVESVTNII